MRSSDRTRPRGVLELDVELKLEFNNPEHEHKLGLEPELKQLEPCHRQRFVQRRDQQRRERLDGEGWHAHLR